MIEVGYWLDKISHEFEVLRATYHDVKRERDSLAARYDEALKRINDMQAELDYLRKEVHR